MPGVSTRSPKGLMSSRCIDVGAAWMAWTAARERLTCCRSEVITPTVASTITMAKKMAASPISSIIASVMSDLHRDGLAHPQRADDEQDDTAHP